MSGDAIGAPTSYIRRVGLAGIAQNIGVISLISGLSDHQFGDQDQRGDGHQIGDDDLIGGVERCAWEDQEADPTPVVRETGGEK